MNTETHRAALTLLVENTPWLMHSLRSVRGCIDAPWCIGAGAVRSLVWDQLHGFPASTPTDVDVAYFDAARRSTETQLEARLSELQPEVRWDIVNQALVHEWPAPCPVVRPLTSLDDGLASWPETATAVGVYLDHAERIGIVAPYGLDDLFGLVLRRSPGSHRPEAFTERVTSKRFRERWPLLNLL